MGQAPWVPSWPIYPAFLVKGFVQPADLPGELGSAGCLLLPSSFEPWTLVVNEATAAGLIIIATERVPHLIKNSCNGFVVEADDPRGLAGVMQRVSNMSLERKERMSRASHELSRQFTPAGWADALLDFAADRFIVE